LCEAQLITARAELQSVRARVAADNVKYQRAPGNADACARAAGLAERVAAFLSAKEKLLRAEHDFEEARRKAALATEKTKQHVAAAVAKAEKEVTDAKQRVASAEKALAADSTTYSPLGPTYPKTSTGRRSALARWIASRDNPLTARVAVNHVWMRHFGRPLVESVYDFGRNGKRPLHPGLLDWLAVEFMDSGWSMKHLHRLIVTSNTYCMQSKLIEQNQLNVAVDGDNRYLWQFPRRRVEAEVVRDSILHAAGELDLHIGGPVLENGSDAVSRRRSVYFSAYPEDGGHLKFLTMFDAPDPCDCYRRSESIVPQQALVMTNSKLLLDESRLLARKLWSQVVRGQAGEQGREAAFVMAAFEQVLSRRPTDQEQEVCRKFLRKQAESLRTVEVSLTKGSEASIAPATEPAMRARESLVRALFSHEDFVTIR
jgi:hypothetical protein